MTPDEARARLLRWERAAVGADGAVGTQEDHKDIGAVSLLTHFASG